MAVKFINSSPGTIINVAVNIFRSDIGNYIWLALAASLWSFLPIYGWAKSTQLAALISIKAYQKILGIEESNKDVARRLAPKLWNFWGLYLIGAVYVFIANVICFSIVFIISYSIARIWSRYYSIDSYILSLLLSFFGVLFYLLIFLLISSLFFWLYGRVSFAELPLAIEPNRSVFGSIARSWYLSRGQGRKIQTIFAIGSFILGILWFSLPNLIFSTVTLVFGGFWLAYLLLASLFIALLQIVKAVIYYDLVCLKEGIDLEITA